MDLDLGWNAKTVVGYCEFFTIRVKLADQERINTGLVRYMVIMGGFVTHGIFRGYLLIIGQNSHQRIVILDHKTLNDGACIPNGAGECWQEKRLSTPPNSNIAPPGWYMLFVVENQVPSISQWISLGGDPANFRNYHPLNPGIKQQDVPGPGIAPEVCAASLSAFKSQAELDAEQAAEAKAAEEKAVAQKIKDDAEKAANKLAAEIKAAKKEAADKADAEKIAADALAAQNTAAASTPSSSIGYRLMPTICTVVLCFFF
jgi:hypothetical protein